MARVEYIAIDLAHIEQSPFTVSVQELKPVLKQPKCIPKKRKPALSKTTDRKLAAQLNKAYKEGKLSFLSEFI